MASGRRNEERSDPLTAWEAVAVEVTDPATYAARKEIFAAAQVIYNQAVARGLWELHPEIRQAIQDQQ